MECVRCWDWLVKLTTQQEDAIRYQAYCSQEAENLLIYQNKIRHCNFLIIKRGLWNGFDLLMLK